MLDELRYFSWKEAKETTVLPAHSSRALNREFEEKLAGKILYKAASTLFLPPSLRIARILWHMIPFVKRGLGCLRHRCMKVDCWTPCLFLFLSAERTLGLPVW